MDTLTRPLWELYDQLPGGSTLLRDWEQNVEAPLNKQSFARLDLTETPGGTLEPGLYLLEVESPDVPKDYRPQRHVLVVSSLNLTLKAGAKEALVWATDLASGKPVAGLNLTLAPRSGASPQTVTTGEDGLARLPLPPAFGSFIAYSTDPFAAASDDWQQGISPWDFGLGDGVAGQAYRAYLYTDRPIYRPGQTVHIKGVLRAEDDAAFRLADVGRVHLIVRDAASTEIFNDTLPVSELGTFDASVTLEEGAPLGSYAIDLEFDGGYAGQTFLVAAYRPPEFEVAVAPDRDEIQRGDSLRAGIAARYFFGGPLANAPVSWTVLEEPYTFKPPWGGRYTFSDNDDPYTCFDCWWYPPTPPAPILSGNGVTGDDGSFTLEVDGARLANALTHRPARLTIEAVVTGPDNQPIAGRKSLIVHPGPYYIGLSPQKYVDSAGQESKIDLVAVDWEGKRLPGKALKVEFYRREWQNTFVKNDVGGGRWEWDVVDTLLETVTVTTDDLGEAVAAFTPPEGGAYRVVASPAEPTAAEKDIRSAVFIWVWGPESIAWRRDNNDRIPLISDKTTYRVGETAEILIPSPFDGPQTALVTVERGRIRRTEVLHLESNTYLYRLPIEAGDIPNIYVSVVLVQGREVSAEGVADFKMGLLPLDVSLEPKTLSLTIEADTEQAEPGQEVAFTVTATGPDGQPVAGAELSLDVVDKAVLSLRPRTEDILSAFYARRALEIRTAAGLTVSANRFLKQLSEELALPETVEVEAQPMALGMGEGAVLEKSAAPVPTMAPEAPAAADRAAGIAPPEGVAVREQFADTAYWSPRLLTDANGQATFT
ncbi:MAG: alpha-2-macroglobulin, partial [Caldilineae bacterium]